MLRPDRALCLFTVYNNYMYQSETNRDTHTHTHTHTYMRNVACYSEAGSSVPFGLYIELSL